MKTLLMALTLMLAAARALAQTATPILPQIPGSLTTGSFEMSGCVSGGIGSGLITMMSPTVAAATQASRGLQPAYQLPPAWSTTPATPIMPPSESGAVATYGTIAPGPVGTVGTTGGAATTGPSGYFLTGVEMSSWVGRRVKVVGIVTSATMDIFPAVSGAANPPFLQEFRVEGVVPLTGPCPQR
jgi:hypothetical protein